VFDLLPMIIASMKICFYMQP